jgi:hypothetical protein
MSKGLHLPQAVHDFSLYAGFVDHFLSKNTTMFTTTSADSGTAAMSDAAGGVIVLTSGDGTAVDNDECYYLTTNEMFLFAPGKPLHHRARVQLAQAATNAANAWIGVMNAVAADALIDNGGGPKANFSGAGFYMRDGSLNWHVAYSDGTTQTLAELTATNSLTKAAQVGATAAGVFTLLEVDCIPKTATLMDVIFKINGSTVYKMMDRTYASATEMNFAVGVKAGTAVNQLLNVDAVACFQKI